MSLSLFLIYIAWLLLILLLMFGMVVFIGTMVLSLSGNAPYVPTPERIIKRMLELADLKDGEILYDLGCGDGRICTYAAKTFKARSIGIERNFALVWFSRILARILRVQNLVEIHRGNIFTTDLSQADVIVMFLLPITNKRMEEKLKRELKPGTRVVSRWFAFPDWKPVKEDKEERLFLYVV